MKNKQRSLRLVATAILFALAAFVTSCKKDADPISGEVSQTASGEATQDSQSDEMDDMATNQLNKTDAAARVATDDDGRVLCALITRDTTNDKTHGTVIIDFDHKANGDPNPDGCTDSRGNVRKGMITIHWEGGRWFHIGSVITITLTNYSINGVVFNGTRTLTNITDNVLKPTWTIVADMTITWPDSKTATRQVHKTRQWDIVGGTLTVTQTAGADFAVSGKTRRGVEYTVAITEGLVFKLSCIATSKIYLPVSGVKVITFKSKVVTIDYGSGECDNSFTVTFSGRTDSVTATNGSDN